MENKFSDRMITQLLNSVFAKCRDLSVSRRSIIYLSRRFRQIMTIIDLLATDKSRHFAQPRPIIVNYPYTAISRKIVGKKNKKTSKCTRQDRKVVWVFTGILHIGLKEIYKFVFLHMENLFFLSGAYICSFTFTVACL